MEVGTTERRDWPWDEMLEAFRALGGAAKNIAIGKGEHDCSLFAVDPAEPVLLRVPANLLISVDEIAFRNGNIQIIESSSVPEAERGFFERYQTTFSWGAGGKSGSAGFVAGLDALPGDIRALLIEEFGFAGLLQGDVAERVQNHFLRSTEIGWQKGPVIAPLLDRTGYDPKGLRPERGKHLQIQGYPRGEISVRRGVQDPCSAFCLYGFAGPEVNAFSLSVRAMFGDRQLAIGRRFIEGEKRGNDIIPRSELQGDALNLSYLPLGNRKFPRQPRGILHRLFRDAGLNNSDEVFDEILRVNALRFIKLMKALEPYEGAMISTLRTVARYQLEAMFHCVGSREIAPA